MAWSSSGEGITDSYLTLGRFSTSRHPDEGTLPPEAVPRTTASIVTLREPPKSARTANVIGRMLGLLVMLAVFAVVVWAAATTQQITAIERTDPVSNAPGDYVVANGIALHYRDTGGSGPVAVLVHDDTVAGGLTVWDVATELAETGRRVVVPDLFGFGFSARPSEPGSRLAVSGQADTLASALEELELGPVHLVGFGWGGEVAAEVAESRPDVVDRLVLVDTTGIPGTPTGWHQLEGLPFGLGTAIAYNREGGAAPAEERFVADCPAWLDCSDPTVREEYRNAVTVPGTARSIWARRASDPAAVAPGRLGEVTVPVTVVAVETTPGDANALASRFGRAESVVTTPGRLAEAIAGGSGEE
jgi:pimeloyl-ACP methyl ester carboxylesterase